MGGPCSPDRTCPEGQLCALVAGEYRCVLQPPADAGNPNPDGSAIDSNHDAATATGWSLVRTRSNEDSSTLTIPATGAGHLIVVAVETSDLAGTGVTDNAGNTYVAVPMGRGVDASENLGIELWYAKASIAGATVITASAPTVWAIAMWEVAGISTTSPLGAANKLDNQAASTTPVGASVTAVTAGEFIVSVAIVGNVVSGLSAGSRFTNDHTSYGNGWAHLTSATEPAGMYQAQWTQPNAASYCSASAAFRVGP